MQKRTSDETEGGETNEELAKINDKMIIALLGLEHLFRELGQMYQSVMKVPKGDEKQNRF